MRTAKNADPDGPGRSALMVQINDMVADSKYCGLQISTAENQSDVEEPPQTTSTNNGNEDSRGCYIDHSMTFHSIEQHLASTNQHRRLVELLPRYAQ